MLRSSIAVPVFLLSALAVPAAGQTTASHCMARNWSTPSCEAAHAREFAAARNAEINLSMAAVMSERARVLALSLTHCKSADSTTPRCAAERTRELAQNLTHCKTPNSTTPRCLAERDNRFAAARNAEINRSVAAVTAERARVLALSLTHCKTADSTTPRCLAEHDNRFAAVRNAEIDRSIAAVEAERARQFAAARNAEINRSLAAVETERTRVLALSLTHCKTAGSTTPRCLSERDNRFAAARNSEIDASLTRVAHLRAFETARNAEIERSIAAVEADRARKFARARNQEIEASTALAAQVRISRFTRERNGEIDAALAAYEAQRVLRIARARLAKYDRPLMAHRTMPSALFETGALGTAAPSMSPDAQSRSRRSKYAEPCSEAGQNIKPLRFSARSAAIDDDMKPELDRLALIAYSCPGVRIKIHGYSDASAPFQVSRHLAVLRAHTVRSYLIAVGVSANRISAMGHGVQRPFNGDAVAENEAHSGYVEFNISDLTIDASATRIMWQLAEVLDPTYIPPLARLSP
jgi:outer membrane protein OmpA-like peptidoglycan-associated protein